MVPMILASGSPRRRELLQQIGLDFTIVVSDADESAAAMAPEALVQQLSRRKAAAVAKLHPDAVIIAADTVVCQDGEILGKPVDTEDAVRMLTRLSGKEHQVYTGFTVQCGAKVHTAVECTNVHVRPLTSNEIARYVATGEPLDKAGAYGIQGLGGVFVTGIEGDYYNVMGLPLCHLATVLQEFGIQVL